MNYDVLKAAIQAVIKENGNQEITGEIMQQVLLAMINTLGSGATFAGVALTSTNPGTPDPKYFYVANGAGTYPHFNNIVVGTNELAFFINPGGTWQKQSVSFTNIGVEIADNLTTESATAALSAKQGVVLKTLIDDLGEFVNLTVEEINEAIAKKADQNGTYPKLVAGAAQNLVGHGSVLAEFTRRTSGGSADIGSGSAEIKKMLGNSIVWNQLAPTKSGSNGLADTRPNEAAGVGVFTISSGTHTEYITSPKRVTMVLDIASDETLFKVIRSGENADFTMIDNDAALVSKIAGHKVLVIVDITAVDYSTIGGYTWDNVQLFDLTLMGIASKILFYADFEKLFSLDYYSSNVGETLNNISTGIETNGFNQWDENWEVGAYNSDGEKLPSEGSPHIRNKNPMVIFPDTNYYFKSSVPLFLYWYDADMNLITGTISARDEIKKSPANAYYLNFYAYEYNSAYNNDICINLSWSGYRNGEYEPYWQNILPLNITTMKGKLNGEGASVAIFPNGMSGLDDIRDEYTKTEAVNRYAEIDLGDLNWDYVAADGLFASNSLDALHSDNPLANKNLAKIICAKYAASPVEFSSQMPDKSIATQLNYLVAGQVTLKIKDSAYTDAATFTAAMRGVKLIYERENPLVYVLDEEQELNYRVDDFGTETQLPQNTSTPTTAPILYEVQYAMNAVDTLRRLPQNYISKESMENLLTAMKNAGLFSAFTMVWNATTQEYDFTITPNV